MKVISRGVRIAGLLGGYALARRLTAQEPRILMYHRFSEQPSNGAVSAGRFAEQLSYVREHFNPITLNQLVAGLFGGQQLPPNAVVLTVDDGYADFHDIAWPILRQYGVPATLFVATGFINRDLWLWPDQMSWILRQAPDSEDPFVRPGLSLTGQAAQADYAGQWERLNDYCLSVSDSDKHATLEALATHWELVLPEQPPKSSKACTWAQLKAMEAQGIEIGGHTVTHPSLGQVTGENARWEIRHCQKMLEEHLGEKVRPFCYPNGTAKDFDERVKRSVQEAGFSCAVAAYHDAAGTQDRWALRRHSGAQDWFQFYKATNGVELLGNRLRQRKRAAK